MPISKTYTYTIRTGNANSAKDVNDFRIEVTAIALPIIFVLLIVISAKKIRANNLLGLASRNDNIWNRESLVAFAKDRYFEIQKAIKKKDAKKLKQYFTSNLYEQWDVMRKDINEQKNIYSINVESIIETDFVSIEDYLDDSKDRFAIEFHVKLKKSEWNVFPNVSVTNEHREYWVFNRKGNDWQLSRILEKNMISNISIALMANYVEK